MGRGPIVPPRRGWVCPGRGIPHVSLKCWAAQLQASVFECPCQAGSDESPPCGHPGWQQRPCVLLCVVSFHSVSQKAPVTGHVMLYSPAKEPWQRISGKPWKDGEGSCSCQKWAGCNLVRLAWGQGLWTREAEGPHGGSSCWLKGQTGFPVVG